jgi:DNA-directed RNA polymerase subunit RPC12/RpoP
MPTCEFLCQKCNKLFQLTYSISEFERARKDGIKCSNCGSSRVIQQVSIFQVQTSKKS